MEDSTLDDVGQAYLRLAEIRIAMGDIIISIKLKYTKQQQPFASHPSSPR